MSKAGIDYFSKSTGFYRTPKIRMLRKKYGSEGVLLLEMLESEAYAEYGYYLPIEEDEDLIFMICDDLDIELEMFEKILEFLIERSFFIEIDCDMGRVLTSQSMQENFFPVARERARKRSDGIYPVIADIWLLPEKPIYTPKQS